MLYTPCCVDTGTTIGNICDIVENDGTLCLKMVIENGSGGRRVGEMEAKIHHTCKSHLLYIFGYMAGSIPS